MNTSRNIPLLYLIKIFQWFMVYMPVVFLFYRENHFSVTELFVLHAIYSVIIVVLEIPSGYVADIRGRKMALVLGTFLGVVGFLAYSLSYTLLGFIIAEIVLGIGESLLSGADTALLYDTLLQQKREHEYVKTEGKITACGSLAEAMAGLFVSIVVLQPVRLDYYIQTGVALLAFVAALFLTEPKVHSVREKPGMKDIFTIVNYTLNKNRLLRNLILFSSVIGFASLTMAWFAQPIFSAVLLPQNFYGYAWVGLNLLVAGGSLLAARLSRFDVRKTFILITIPMSLGFIAMALSLNYWVVIAFVIFYVTRGFAHPLLKKHINEQTESHQRATVLSVRSLLIRILYSVFGPLLGYFSDHYSLKTALMLCGAMCFVLSAASLVAYFRGLKLSAATN